MGVYPAHSASLVDPTGRAVSGFRLLRLTHKAHKSPYPGGACDEGGWRRRAGDVHSASPAPPDGGRKWPPSDLESVPQTCERSGAQRLSHLDGRLVSPQRVAAAEVADGKGRL